ncbi:hypothetical protein, unlikely [Trypanosoma brucei gambiense DAL972]|uniref:argininosuccinate synthase n=1 Tax=Trypanosoma brucei gambiense (strain MHOM/CI/86/DAL972) TaxID=679716 RepID=C9ZPR0_TRYB9|nr:hypothetical protein, unlikely [Trypanosoma brucei gambiense DAL972]CBH11388.1 hypothetical protein, unlikely [Trypanosoma brucei gambiense DAL972]|eukprot:XP_011773675.1 hypothetical protein, unlikely [Trypanosoma brucei gambiense DAL972]
METHSSICGITCGLGGEVATPTPRMVLPASKCPATPEFCSIAFRAARCVRINDVDVTPVQALQLANEIAGRNGVGLEHTQNNEMCEAPGMTLLSKALHFIYDVCFDRGNTDAFRMYSRHVSSMLSSRGFVERQTLSSLEAIRHLTADVDGVVDVEVNRGEVIFLKVSHVSRPVKLRLTKIMTDEELEEVFQPGDGTFGDVQW